jgi:hypothetical protein
MNGRLGPATTVLAVLAVLAKSASTQTVEPTNSAPNPYRAIYDWVENARGATLGLDGRRRYRPGSCGLPNAVALLRCRPS